MIFSPPKPSFGQRLGLEALPAQMDRSTISPELRSYAWAIIRDSMTSESRYNPKQITAAWKGALIEWFVRREFRASDEFPIGYNRQHDYVKSIVYSDEYIKFFDFMQFLIENRRVGAIISGAIEEMLRETRSAYRVVGSLIVPVSSEENAHAVAKAFEISGKHPAQGPRTHLRAAAEKLSGGDWGGSIRESIHAVEAAAKVVEPDANELGPALTRLEKRAAINPAMKRAFGALYGFSSDEKGIRHSLVYDEQANVSEADAMFMFGACAAFVSYLLSQP